MSKKNFCSQLSLRSNFDKVIIEDVGPSVNFLYNANNFYWNSC